MSVDTRPKELLSEREAAEYLAISPATLRTWRCIGQPTLPFVRVGGAIRYRRSDLESWVEERTVYGEGK